MKNNKYKKPLKFQAKKDASTLIFLLLIFMSECTFVLIIPYIYLGEIPDLSIKITYFFLAPNLIIFLWIWSSSAYYLFGKTLVFHLGPFYRKLNVQYIWEIRLDTYPLLGFNKNSSGASEVLEITTEEASRLYPAPKDPMALYDALKAVNQSINFLD